jgi:ABC-type Zn2+ transport system substrate-binding protein/surface adhesin
MNVLMLYWQYDRQIMLVFKVNFLRHALIVIATCCLLFVPLAEASHSTEEGASAYSAELSDCQVESDHDEHEGHDHHAHQCGQCHVHIIRSGTINTPVIVAIALKQRRPSNSEIASARPSLLYRPPRT